MKLAAVALAVAIATIASCSRCGSAPGDASTGAPAASIDGPSSSASASAAAAPDLPEIKDTGPGRATAALRAALTAYGIPFDAATLERECEVDEDGASIDTLEDVATDKYGLDATQAILPAEHLLLAESKAVPAIVIADGPPGSDMLDFVLVWKIEGDRALIMDPAQGRAWVPRAELAKRIEKDELTLPAEDWHAAESQPSFHDAVRARLVALGLDREAAQALVARAAADPASRALGALEAASRQLEADPAPAGGDARAFVTKVVDCALDAACTTEPVPASFYSARPAPKAADGRAQVQVRGALLLAISGRKTPSQ